MSASGEALTTRDYIRGHLNTLQLDLRTFE
ncbi:F0F1 ATP synthase subunit A, partial [Klebsiella oxytoca]